MNQEKALAFAEEMVELFVKYDLTYLDAIELCEELSRQIDTAAKSQKIN